ncbi:MAG: DUF4190 domain-containing protein [Flavobacteriales bacterium]|nr:DUF4190 domain-containing protein [Flavobacteriales bacterium]
MEKQKLPNGIAVLILGIASILSCCFYGIGLILAIVALVLAKKDTALYNQNPEGYANYGQIKTGKILAIIGLVINIIYLLFAIWLIATVGFENLQDQDAVRRIMTEKFGG